MARKVTAAAALLLLAGCGGGGGSGGGNGVLLPANASPVITTVPTLSVAENVAEVVQLTATDGDGDALSWTIAGGADGARFTTAGAQLRFAAAPDFDAPADADGNNIYLVTVAVSDGKTSVTLPLQVTVTNSAEGVALRRIGNVGEPLVGATRLKDGSIRLAGRLGIYAYNPVTNAVTPQLRFAAGQNGEILSITADRGPLIEPHMLVSTRRSGGQVDVWLMWGREALERSFEPVSLGPQPIYTLPFDPAVAEVGGKLGTCISGRTCIAFGSLGLPTGSTNPHYGSIVEFVPNPDPYAGASVGPSFLPPVIGGTGLRLPMALAHDIDAAGFPIGLVLDRGTTHWDEVNRVLNANPVPNYGWPWREGTDEVQAGGPAGLFGPELVMARGTGAKQAQGLTSLAFYKGANASLAGKLLIADRSGRIFAVPVTAFDNGAPNRPAVIEDRTLDFRPDSGTVDVISAMLSVGGELLLLDRDGDLFVMEG